MAGQDGNSVYGSVLQREPLGHLGHLQMGTDGNGVYGSVYRGNHQGILGNLRQVSITQVSDSISTTTELE